MCPADAAFLYVTFQHRYSLSSKYFACIFHMITSEYGDLIRETWSFMDQSADSIRSVSLPGYLDTYGVITILASISNGENTEIT